MFGVVVHGRDHHGNYTVVQVLCCTMFAQVSSHTHAHIAILIFVCLLNLSAFSSDIVAHRFHVAFSKSYMKSTLFVCFLFEVHCSHHCM